MPVTGRTSCWPSFGTSQRRRRDVPVSAAGVAYGADGRSKLTVGSTAADALSRGEAPGAAGSDGRALVERLVRGCGARLESRCAVSRACACATVGAAADAARRLTALFLAGAVGAHPPPRRCGRWAAQAVEPGAVGAVAALGMSLGSHAAIGLGRILVASEVGRRRIRPEGCHVRVAHWLLENEGWRRAHGRRCDHHRDTISGFIARIVVCGRGGGLLLCCLALLLERLGLCNRIRTFHGPLARRVGLLGGGRCHSCLK